MKVGTDCTVTWPRYGSKVIAMRRSAYSWEALPPWKSKDIQYPSVSSTQWFVMAIPSLYLPSIFSLPMEVTASEMQLKAVVASKGVEFMSG
jgi:hypothetical protein